LTLNVPDESYSNILALRYLLKVILIVWLWAYLMKVILIFWLWAYLMKVILIFWLWASPDEGYSRNALCALNFISAFLLSSFEIVELEHNYYLMDLLHIWTVTYLIPLVQFRSMTLVFVALLMIHFK
jgi:hypothetical protein